MKEILGVKLRSEAYAEAVPEYSWNQGDLNAENYDDLLLAEQSLNEGGFYEDGFYVEYRDWRFYNTEDSKYEYKMFYIDGVNWVNRFNQKTTVEFKGKAREGSLAILALGLNGLVDLGLSFGVWFVFLNDKSTHTVKPLYWYSWLVMFITMIVTQAGLFIVWPTSYYGTSLSLEFAYGLAEASKSGPFGLYEISLIFLIVCMWGYPVETIYYSANILPDETNEKIMWTVLGIGLYGLNSFFTFWFTPQVYDYWQLIKKAEEEEEAKRQEALQADSNLDDFGPNFF